MQHKERWKPTKFVIKDSVLKASRDETHVSVASRLMVDCIAAFYETILPKNAHGKLLDLGCGNVPLFEKYQSLVEENTCVDWGNTLHKNEYLDLEADLNEPLPLADNTFDTVILSDVLEHIRRPEQLIQEINRVLKSGGTFIMNVPFFYHLHEEPFDFFRYTKHALRSMSEENGFEVVYLEPLGGIPEILADIIAKYFVGFPVIGKSISKFVQWKVRVLNKTAFGKRISTKTAQRFPLAYGMVAKKI
ncbi:MAG: methyltransferase domain-containing protein [Spirosomaceae bacterium]|nr:methyltransferase domain-containing protein [Spirosomataceae bacterium]